MTSASDGSRARLTACAFSLCALLSGQARAGDEYVESDVRMAARVLAAQGSEAFERHDFAQALALFERAGAIIQAPTLTLMEARSLMELGRLVEALEKYGATQRMLTVDPNNDVFRQAADAATREAEPLLQRIPTLRVRVIGANPYLKLDIQIDGKRVMPGLAAVDRPLDPGPHHVEVHGADGSSAARELVLAEGSHEDVELTLAKPTPVASAAPPAPEASGGGGANTLGWVVGGSGAALALVGTITGVMALNHKSDLDAVCRPGCPPAKADEIQAFRRDRTLSFVGFGLGGLGLVGGAYLLLFHPFEKVAVSLSPHLVAVGGTFQ